MTDHDNGTRTLMPTLSLNQLKLTYYNVFVYDVTATPFYTLHAHQSYCDTYSSFSVISHVFSVLCMYSKFRHHPYHLGYL